MQTRHRPNVLAVWSWVGGGSEDGGLEFPIRSWMKTYGERREASIAEHAALH